MGGRIYEPGHLQRAQAGWRHVRSAHAGRGRQALEQEQASEGDQETQGHQNGALGGLANLCQIETKNIATATKKKHEFPRASGAFEELSVVAKTENE